MLPRDLRVAVAARVRGVVAVEAKVAAEAGDGGICSMPRG
jgi:hypothetical protein